MAAHETVEYSVAEGNDYPAHEQMYQNFITIVKWGTSAIAVLLILMAYFLV